MIVMDKYCVGKWIPTYRPTYTIRFNKLRRIRRKNNDLFIWIHNTDNVDINNNSYNHI